MEPSVSGSKLENSSKIFEGILQQGHLKVIRAQAGSKRVQHKGLLIEVCTRDIG